jgi:adenosylmethionine-8-amino-7-oxononanoate aminotransferase
MSATVTMINDGDVSLKQESANGTAISIGERESAVLHRHLHQPPLRVVSAHGNYLTLEGGRKVFDATGGAAVACIGHGNEAVKVAVQRQMDQVSYCHSLFFSSSGAENLARLLIESTDGVMARAIIVSSGKSNLYKLERHL